MEQPLDNPSYVSDCESEVSGGQTPIDRGFVPAGERGESVRTIFIGSLGGLKPEVVDIRRNAHSSVMAQARAQSFQIFAHAMAKLRDGNANLKFAWYGASGEEEIADIVQHGFGPAHSNGLHGLRHLLLCRVILGKTEVVPRGSNQCCWSSEEYDSGVDDLSDPKEYVIWSNRINTHVLPEYVLSFRLPSSKGLVFHCFIVSVVCFVVTLPVLDFVGHVKIGEPLRFRPKSPWVPFPALVLMLSKILPQRDVAFIAKSHMDYIEKRISRHEMIQKVRLIAGDKLLLSVIKAFRAK
ncbi:putative inactive poly [ADP-ribose] polymerase SRO5, partial [Mucuna pruriens]